MTDLSDALTAEWRALLGADSLSGRESALARLARDFFWFSPVLRCQLDSKRAGLGVRPSSVDEVRADDPGPLSLQGADCSARRRHVKPQGHLFLPSVHKCRLPINT
jgi:hypothetical protein